MRIGIDATNLQIGWAGVGQYIINLARSLSCIDKVNEYFIFLQPETAAALEINASNFQSILVDQPYRPLRLAWEQYGLPFRVKRLNIDVLHSPHYTMPIISRCKRVVTFHDMTYQLYPEMHRRFHRVFFPRMMRWSARHADRLIAVSESTRGDTIRLTGIDPDKIISIPLAASKQYRRLSAAETKTICDRYDLIPNRYVCYVGVLEPRKDVPSLIRAFARIAASTKDIPLVIIGKKGWMYDEIFSLVNELGLESRVKIVGYVPTSDLVGLYNGARMFVYPSRYEGFGLPVLEAMQCGAPVITTDISSMPEVAGGAALFVSPNNVDDLTATMQALLADESLASRLSDMGVARAQNFSWHRCATETLRVYESAYQQ